MTYAKDMIENEEYTYRLLLEIGAIKNCEFHDDYYYNTGMESNQIYGMVSNKYKEISKSENVPQWLRDSIKKILDSAGDSKEDCPRCTKVFGE